MGVHIEAMFDALVWETLYAKISCVSVCVGTGDTAGERRAISDSARTKTITTGGIHMTGNLNGNWEGAITGCAHVLGLGVTLQASLYKAFLYRICL